MVCILNSWTPRDVNSTLEEAAAAAAAGVSPAGEGV